LDHQDLLGHLDHQELKVIPAHQVRLEDLARWDLVVNQEVLEHLALKARLVDQVYQVPRECQGRQVESDRLVHLELPALQDLKELEDQPDRRVVLVNQAPRVRRAMQDHRDP